MSFELRPVGYVRSTLKDRSGAPRQGWEGAPRAIVEINPDFRQGLEGMQAGEELWILTWLHESARGVLNVHPRGDALNPLTGVFATRSPDRPNPIGLHRVKVLNIEGERFLEVEDMDAIDGTPILDIKPVIERKWDF